MSSNLCYLLQNYKKVVLVSGANAKIQVKSKVKLSPH